MLSGLTVIEQGGFVAVPYCARLLADLGARVIKIEPPEGDIARRHGPYPPGKAGMESSGLFAFLNSGKESVVLDSQDAEARSFLACAARRADVWISDRPWHALRDIGADEETLRALNPRLVYCAHSPFGRTGPYSDRAGGSLHAAALSGVAWAIGVPGRSPLSLPLAQTDFQAGVHGAAAILAALLCRRRSGVGQFIDIAMADILAAYAGIGATLFINYGLPWRREGRRAAGSMGPYPCGIFPCKDGLVVLIARTPRDWDQFLKAVGSPAWGDNPRYRDQIAMGHDYPDEVDALVIGELARYTQTELFAMARKWEFPCAPVRQVGDTLDDAHFAARGFFIEQDLPGIGRVKLPRLPFRYSLTPQRAFALPPSLGQHTAAVREELGASQ